MKSILFALHGAVLAVGFTIHLFGGPDWALAIAFGLGAVSLAGAVYYEGRSR